MMVSLHRDPPRRLLVSRRKANGQLEYRVESRRTKGEAMEVGGSPRRGEPEATADEGM